MNGVFMKVSRVVLALAALLSTALAAAGTVAGAGNLLAAAQPASPTEGQAATWLDQWLANETARPASGQKFDSAG